MKIDEIMKILPHRQPFLLVDEITEIVPNHSATGKKCVSFNEPFFAGHFPDEPVMPGVLLIEAAAQVGAVAILAADEWHGGKVYLGSVKQVRFKRKVVPGDVLVIETVIPNQKGSIGNCQFHIRCGDDLVAEGALLFSIKKERNMEQ